MGRARCSDRNAANSQCFVCRADARNVSGDYSVVGVVTDGFYVLDKIKKAGPGAPGGTVQNPDKIVKMSLAKPK